MPPMPRTPERPKARAARRRERWKAAARPRASRASTRAPWRAARRSRWAGRWAVRSPASCREIAPSLDHPNHGVQVLLLRRRLLPRGHRGDLQGEQPVGVRHETLETVDRDPLAQEVGDDPEVERPLGQPLRFADAEEHTIDVVHGLHALHRLMVPDEALPLDPIGVALLEDRGAGLAVPELAAEEVRPVLADEIDGLLDRLRGLAGEAGDEGAEGGDAALAQPGDAPGVLLDGRRLVHVLEDGGRAR